jgi:hypothetical protein
LPKYEKTSPVDRPSELNSATQKSPDDASGLFLILFGFGFPFCLVQPCGFRLASLFTLLYLTTNKMFVKRAELIFWLAGIILVAGWLATAYLSPNARLRRRRRKSHSRIVSKTNRPSVRFNVRPPKK